MKAMLSFAGPDGVTLSYEVEMKIADGSRYPVDPNPTAVSEILAYSYALKSPAELSIQATSRALR